MAAAPIISILLLAVVTKCSCESSSGHSNNNRREDVANLFGELLKPPPPPSSFYKVVPAPFHGGRLQRHNLDVGYHYQPPPPPPPPPVSVYPPNDFKFPAPFYKQYNFNVIPHPQSFTTTSSPSLFQKVSGWLFPSQQTSYDLSSQSINNNHVAPVKQDCNPCNLVPWIPVIRYNLGGKNVGHSSIPTYGPPSPTAAQSAVQYRPQTFHSTNQKQQNLQHLSNALSVLHESTNNSTSSPIKIPNTTYGPPSGTHIIETSSSKLTGPPYSVSSSSFGLPSPSSPIYKEPSSFHSGLSSFQTLSSSYYNTPSLSQVISSTTYRPLVSTYGPPSVSYETPVSINYDHEVKNEKYPDLSNTNVLKDLEPLDGLKLPTVSVPTGFKNSYGESISISNTFDVPNAISAADETSEIKTKILPHDKEIPVTPNISLALAHPAPFTLNKGRNIHTLQPVALPNLSVSPLPPIFNARPFKPITPKIPTNYIQGINNMQHTSHNVNIEQSVPVEFSHSVEYPATIVQSPVIDIDVSKNSNQSKAYRNIPSSYIVDVNRDISSQASEDHVSATKSNNDASFESTGVDFGNVLYESSIYTDFKGSSRLNSNHKTFADLRDMKDEDVDKYRIESNLQSIDSPLLYLRPSAPHKDFGNFLLTTLTPINSNDYEIYDDVPTTAEPYTSTLSSHWDKGRTDYVEDLSPLPVGQEDRPKIVQIIIPYTSQQETQSKNYFQSVSQQWVPTVKDEVKARKVSSNTENQFNINLGTGTESYTIVATATEESTPSVTDYYDEKFNTPTVINNLYDVTEPPFDIIKLQHNIDDWTEQQYSKRHKTSQRSRNGNKYAKQIPDEYFSTTSPITNYVTNNYNYEFYDHEVSSSIHHPVTENRTNAVPEPRKEYNVVYRNKNATNRIDQNELQKLHIHTASSSFRTTTISTTTTTTTTPAPWAAIQTSISPLTKEKVYVVTSKPWRESSNATNEWYDSFESKKTKLDNYSSLTDNLPFKSPRFSNRPSLGFTTNGNAEALRSDSSYGFSKSWYQRINDLESRLKSNSKFFEPLHQKEITHSDEIAVIIAEEDIWN